MELSTGLTALLGLYVAFHLGANDVANSMGTSVGSKALTLRRAILLAAILEFAGAVLFGRGVSATLATRLTCADRFAGDPQVLLVGMVSVLLACGIWLQVATSRGLPVASSHAIVGAIAGFSWVAAGVEAVRWGTIAAISITWIATPVFSGAIALGLYRQIDRWILTHPEARRQLDEWLPWLSALLVGAFGAIVLPVLAQAPAIAAVLERTENYVPERLLYLSLGAIAIVALTVWNGWQAPDPDRGFSPIEAKFARLQVLSACFVAFAHGSNDVGNAVAPLAAIAYIRRTGTVPGIGFEVPLPILVLGGIGIVAGLALFGKNVITTVGEGIVSLQPSSGFCAELATAITVLLASRLGLPVSTSHALVGGAVGVGWVNARRHQQPIEGTALRGIVWAWLFTVPVGAGLGAALFVLLRLVV
jgi:PiT family inorganic phosphate transporter